MGKKLIWPKFDLQNFFVWVLLLLMLDIVASYHRIQFQGKLVIQTQENSKKPHSELDLGLLGPNSDHSFFFFFFFFSKIWLGQSLDIMFSYHHVQYQKKLIIQS